MKADLQLSVPLSHLVPSRRNPRKVRPSKQAHGRLVALIRAYGLLQPLVIRPWDEKPKHFQVVAGERRLRALREIHRDNGDPAIPCILRDVDEVTADAVSLGENFGREAMHPLDEAEAFAKLAAEQAKGVDGIAAEFGVPERYVRQRMKLAGLASVVKKSYRESQIDTATAEAFAAVPQDRQSQLWQEMDGHPYSADQVRRAIAHDWIDSALARFEVSSLPESAVSGDLFSERVLIERQAFMAAQTQAMEVERNRLLEEGWHEVVMGRSEEIQHRAMTMDTAIREFDEPTSIKLAKLEERRVKLEAKLDLISEDDEKALAALQQKLEALETEVQQVEKDAPGFHSEATKAVGTVFLMLYADGQMRCEYRVERPRPHPSNSSNGSGSEQAHLTSDELGDQQLAVTFTHQTLAVRDAVLEDDRVRKCILAMILHEKIRSEALAIRHDANAVTICAEGEGFSSPILDRLRAKRVKLDPLFQQPYVDDETAYQHLCKLSAAKLDALIDLLVAEHLTAHLQRRTGLVQLLADELKVNVRESWRPDVAWLAGYRKIQLGHLISELKGPEQAPGPEARKSDLVNILDELFTQAAEGKLEDKQLAERVNHWLPSNLRKLQEDAADPSPATTTQGS